MDCSTPGSLVLHCLSEFIQIYVHWVGDAIQPSPPLSPLLLLHSIFPSIRVFSNEWALRIRWPKYWSFNFSISPSNDYSGLISFRIDWFNFLVLQGRGRLREQLEPGGCNSSELHSSLSSISVSPCTPKSSLPLQAGLPSNHQSFQVSPCGLSILREVLINNRKLSLPDS